jgi:hypothetical protein
LSKTSLSPESRRKDIIYASLFCLPYPKKVPSNS